jgi:hypothetical protein
MHPKMCDQYNVIGCCMVIIHKIAMVFFLLGKFNWQMF